METLESRTAQLNLHGYNVTNATGLNERVYKKKLIEGQQSNKKILVFGSSRVMKLGTDVLEDNSLLNLSVSMSAMEDIISQYLTCRANGLCPDKVYIGLDPAIFFTNADLRWKKVYKKTYNDFVSGAYAEQALTKPPLPSESKYTHNEKEDIIRTLYPASTYMFERKDLTGEYRLDSIFNLVYTGTKNLAQNVNDTIGYMNQFISRPSFYDDISVFEELFLNTTGEALIEETKKYRNLEFDNLPAFQQNNIMKLNRIILELTYGCPESGSGVEFPTLTKYNKESAMLADGTHTYVRTYEHITAEAKALRLKGDIKKPHSIRKNQKMECPNKAIFEKFIALLLSEGVEIHFVLPPLHPELYKSLISRKEFAFLEIFEEYVKCYAEENDIILHGTFNPIAAGCIEADFFDGNHIRVPGLQKIFE